MVRVRGRDWKDSGAQTGSLGSEGDIWLSKDRPALSLPARLSLTYEWIGRQGAALEASFTEGKLKQEGGDGPLAQSPSTGNPVGGVATSWELGV